MYLGFGRYLNLITKRFMLLCMNAWGKGNCTKEGKNKHRCRLEFISTANIAGKTRFMSLCQNSRHFFNNILALIILKL